MGTMRARRASKYGRREKSKGWESGIFGGMAARGESMSFSLLFRRMPFRTSVVGWLMWEGTTRALRNHDIEKRIDR